MLALIRGEPSSGERAAAVHFGCSLPDGATARDFRARLRPELDFPLHSILIADIELGVGALQILLDKQALLACQ